MKESLRPRVLIKARENWYEVDDTHRRQIQRTPQGRKVVKSRTVLKLIVLLDTSKFLWGSGLLSELYYKKNERGYNSKSLGMLKARLNMLAILSSG